VRRVEGKVALITGAARGQGRSHAVRLAEEGANIIGLDLPPATAIGGAAYPMAGGDDFAETVKLVEEKGGRIIACSADVRDQTQVSAAVATGILFLPVVVMLLFRRKYPGWWFDWNLELTRFTTRISAYLLLLDDRYPSTDDHQSVHLDLERPDGAALSRWLPLVKWLLAFPHYVVLFALAIGAFFVVICAWFAILFTGRYPRWAFDYNVGVMRWGLRVEAYALLLTTDRYPPFSL